MQNLQKSISNLSKDYSSLAFYFFYSVEYKLVYSITIHLHQPCSYSKVAIGSLFITDNVMHSVASVLKNSIPFSLMQS